IMREPKIMVSDKFLYIKGKALGITPVKQCRFYFSSVTNFLNRSPENLTQILLYLWKQIAEDGLLSSLLRLELQDTPLEAAV
ncbi:hypothetical protein CLI75_12565, partial [Porphyromonas gingivalis]